MIGGMTVRTHLSNPNPGEKNPIHNYHNVNLLGMNFLRKFKGFKIGGDFNNNVAFLELIK
jgi:hypothetical protein